MPIYRNDSYKAPFRGWRFLKPHAGYFLKRRRHQSGVSLTFDAQTNFKNLLMLVLNRFRSVCAAALCLLLLSLAGHAQKGFTRADAAKAYTDFNRHFYDSGRQLYRGTTETEGVAAIWVQAIYWDVAMHVYERTKDAAQLQFIKDIYAGNYNQYDGYNWSNHKVWFIWDDMMWWVMAFARAHQLTGDTMYLRRSIEGFDHVWQGSYDPVNGGMFWNFQKSGKNACINYPTVIAAMRLYHITKDTAYLAKAKKVYGWSRANLFNAANGRVADHKVDGRGPGYEDYTYNQGTCIGAATALYKVTGDTMYLADAKQAANYTRDSMSKGGILPAEGDYNEQGILKSIFAHYLMELVDEYGQTQYLPWVAQNIALGWANRDKGRGITYRNYAVPCPTGTIQSYEASSIPTFLQLYFRQGRR